MQSEVDPLVRGGDPARLAVRFGNGMKARPSLIFALLFASLAGASGGFIATRSAGAATTPTVKTAVPLSDVLGGTITTATMTASGPPSNQQPAVNRKP